MEYLSHLVCESTCAFSRQCYIVLHMPVLSAAQAVKTLLRLPLVEVPR
jgi:hypothetical protein